jgi:enoyl-CoA hydratase/carnithine racemase
MYEVEGTPRLRALKNVRVTQAVVLSNLHHSAGIVSLHDTHKGNTLSKTLIAQLSRSVRSLDIDKDVKAILIKGDDLSTGTDLLFLAKRFQETGQVDLEYLRSLYQLVHDFATTDTPIIPLLSGRAYGSGAVLAAFSPFTIAEKSAKIKFPEASVGFIPTGGASFLLSRMPGEMGTYLALTGKPLVRGDGKFLKMVYNYAELNEELIEELTVKTTYWNTLGTRELVGDIWSDNLYVDRIGRQANLEGDSEEIVNRTNLGTDSEPLRENLRMVLADIVYKQQSEAYYDKVQGSNYRKSVRYK